MEMLLKRMPEMIEVRPQDGGCWFCHTASDLEELHFDSEFDTNVHLSCIRAAIELDQNPEAEIQSYLFDEKYQGGYTTIASKLPINHPVIQKLLCS